MSAVSPSNSVGTTPTSARPTNDAFTADNSGHAMGGGPGRAALWRLAAVFACLAALALAIDLPAARLCRGDASGTRWKLPGDVRKMLSLQEYFGHGGSAAVIVLSIFVLDVARRRQIPLLLAQMYGAGILANILKFAWARRRPLSADLDVEVFETFLGFLPQWRDVLGPQVYGWSVQSFPSGHTATAAGLAIGLSGLYPHGRWLFAVLAAATALQRVESGAHWPSDTLAAAALACFWCGWLAGVGLASKGPIEPSPSAVEGGG